MTAALAWSRWMSRATGNRATACGSRARASTAWHRRPWRRRCRPPRPRRPPRRGNEKAGLVIEARASAIQRPAGDAPAPAVGERREPRPTLSRGERDYPSVRLLAQERRDIEHVHARLPHRVDGDVAAAADRGGLVELLVVHGGH